MSTGLNSYEEARQKRLWENLKKIEGLGITTIKNSLSEIAKCKAKKNSVSPMSKKIFAVSELRRSSRARSLVSSYREDEHADIERYLQRNNKRKCHRRDYNGVVASYEERIEAINRAEKFQNKLGSTYPSFIKPMVRSHVSSCFWLGLPSWFCKDHLPSEQVNMVLEDEDGVEYGVVYIGSRTGLSGGWKGFALDHELNDGDALLFELVKSDRFKVHIFKAVDDDSNDGNDVTNLENRGQKSQHDLDDKHAVENKDLPSKCLDTSNHPKRPAGKGDNENMRATHLEADLKTAGGYTPNRQNSQMGGALSSRGRSKRELNQNNGEDYDEKLTESEVGTNSSTEIRVEDATDVQNSQTASAKSKGRVKRQPRSSRI